MKGVNERHKFYVAQLSSYATAGIQQQKISEAQARVKRFLAHLTLHAMCVSSKEAVNKSNRADKKLMAYASWHDDLDMTKPVIFSAIIVQSNAEGARVCRLISTPYFPSRTAICFIVDTGWKQAYVINSQRDQ